jgi:hypothetical protein
VVLNRATLAVSVVMCIGSWTSVLLKSSALKGIGVTAESNEKVNFLKAKMQWVNLSEDGPANGQNMLEKIQWFYFCNLCVRCRFFAPYYLQKFFPQ